MCSYLLAKQVEYNVGYHHKMIIVDKREKQNDILLIMYELYI